eukprot:6208022-Pleurochrysis_carterae.AAC.4
MASVPFYLYDSPPISMEWLRACESATSLKGSVSEWMGDVAVHDALKHHEWRTRNPAGAQLFFMPFYEWTSLSVGECNGTTHAERMASAATAIQTSSQYQASGGRDHVWASTGQSAMSYAQRMGRLWPVVRPGIAGLFKSYCR